LNKEKSAQNLDLDISDTRISLTSPNYAFDYQFEQEIVSEEGVKAKFNKSKHVLQITLQLKH
jgi:hypothetical protein